MRHPRRSSIAKPTTIVMVTAPPEHKRPANPASNPSQSRRSMGPSWSASKRCASPSTRDATKPIWNAQRMFSSPAPNSTNSDAAAVASQGSTPARSEEHTSELQSHVNLVCRLLLEKKKIKNLTIFLTKQKKKKKQKK